MEKILKLAPKVKMNRIEGFDKTKFKIEDEAYKTKNYKTFEDEEFSFKWCVRSYFNKLLCIRNTKIS